MNARQDARNEQDAGYGLESPALWRLLRYFSYYRLIASGFLFGQSLIVAKPLHIAGENPLLFEWVAGAYFLAAILVLFVQHRWQHALQSQLSIQVLIDLYCLALLLFASGGAKSGMTMLLLVVLVGAALVGKGRLVLFYAAVATLLLLAEQAYRVVHLGGEPGDFFYTGLTCLGLFGAAIGARLLANRMIEQEELARQRGIDLEDQLRINARVIRDMQDGVLVVAADGQVRQCNPRAHALLGCADRFSGVLDELSPALAAEFAARLARGIESEWVMQAPATGRVLRIRFLPPAVGGNALLFVEDVGRQQQEARQVKLAALGRLTANLAHEIRNPLSAISHAAELLADEPPGAGTQRLTRIIADNTQRLNHLVSEVGELGQRDRVSPETIALRDYLNRAIDELALIDPANAARIAVDVPDGTTILFDRGHFHRVLVNLLENALHHASRAPGAVRVNIEDGGGHPQTRPSLHCIDDGPGIDPAVRDRIFEPFFTTRPTGVGLGLYIARELCEANGARLFLLDNAPGAHFCLSFAPPPLEQETRAT